MMGRFANILIIILEILGLRVSIGDRKWRIFAYYTQISNLITIVSSIIIIHCVRCCQLFPIHYGKAIRQHG